MSKFKFMLSFLAALLSLSIVATPSFADSIGFVDVDKILITYKDAKEYQKELEEKREDFQETLEKRQNEINKAREKNKSPEKIEELIKEMEEELRPKQEAILKYEADIQRSLLTEIMSTSKVVAQEYGIDVVVDKRVLYVGGFDLTDFVIDRLNRK